MSSDQGEASGPGQASHQLDQAELGGGRGLGTGFKRGRGVFLI